MPEAKVAKLLNITPEGWVFQVDENKEEVLVKYNSEITDAKEIRKIAVSMHIEAFNKLGVVYRIKNGYYEGALKQIIHHTGGAKRWMMTGGAVVTGVFIAVLLAKSRPPKNP